MGFLGRAMKGGLALKAARVVKREASKPKNQQKAKDLVSKFTQRGGKKPRRR